MVNTEDKENKIKTLSEDIALLESYIEDLFSFTPLPLCFVNSKGLVLEVNPAFIKKTGYDEYDVVGESFFSFLEKKEAENMLREVMEKGAIEGKEATVKTKEGAEIQVTVSARTRKVKGGEISGAFFSFFDMTEIKKKEDEIKETNKKLQEKIEEAERINRLTIGRELKMVELKEEIEKLKEELKKHKGT